MRHGHEMVRELLGHLFRAQEEERARIATDIHDDSIQVMTAVGLRLDALRRRLTDPEAVETLQPLAETVTSAPQLGAAGFALQNLDLMAKDEDLDLTIALVP